MEICIINNYNCVLELNNRKKIKDYGLNLNDIKDSKLVKFAKENPEYVFMAGAIATITISTIAEIGYGHGASVACGAAGFVQIETIFKDITRWAKRALVFSVIFNTMKDAIQILWRNSGGKMSWDDIFGAVFKNLAILGIGLAIDKAAWALYEALS